MAAVDSGNQTDAGRIEQFLHLSSERLSALAHEPPASDGARRFADALARSTPTPYQRRWLPSLDTLHLMELTPVGRHFVDIAPLLPWSPTSRVADDGADFAFCEVNLVRDLGDLTVGIMYMRPQRTYPLHRHPPHEVYLTVAGNALWRYGGHDEFRSVGPGSMIYNHPDDLHSVVSGDTPMVALYVLWT